MNALNAVARDGKPNSPTLLAACEQGDSETAVYLLNEGASPYSERQQGEAIVSAFALLFNGYRCTADLHSVLRCMRENGWKADERFHGGHTPLSMAIIIGNHLVLNGQLRRTKELDEATEILISSGADANDIFEGKSLLEHALRLKRIKTTELLMEHGARLSEPLRQWADRNFSNKEIDGTLYRYITDLAKRYEAAAA